MAVETGILLESGTNDWSLWLVISIMESMWQRLMNFVRIKSQRWCRMHMST